jgi:predicted hydrolase (HD superfamily)
MEEKKPTRQEALELLHQYNESDSLRKHAYAVEGVMRYIGRKRGEDEEKWGLIGLIHDLDMRSPDQHCTQRERSLIHQWPEEYIRALSHGWGICSDLMPQTP